MCVWVVAQLITSKTKINGLKKISSLQVSLGDHPFEKILKNADLSLRGKQSIVLPKWTFSAF